ncbi:MAG: nucleotidyltransferase domain-containing protein [Parcubacteria group bacterium]|nr:nucleotidyltransferase domain-containing protein [Parcubacteria group bacterium]
MPILEEHRVTYAAVFGSVARNEDTPESDVDLLVCLPSLMGMFSYMRLIHDLETCLNRKVDVVTEQSLNKFVKPYIKADLKVIYEG